MAENKCTSRIFKKYFGQATSNPCENSNRESNDSKKSRLCESSNTNKDKCEMDNDDAIISEGMRNIGIHVDRQIQRGRGIKRNVAAIDKKLIILPSSEILPPSHQLKAQYCPPKTNLSKLSIEDKDVNETESTLRKCYVKSKDKPFKEKLNLTNENGIKCCAGSKKENSRHDVKEKKSNYDKKKLDKLRKKNYIKMEETFQKVKETMKNDKEKNMIISSEKEFQNPMPITKDCMSGKTDDPEIRSILKAISNQSIEIDVKKEFKPIENKIQSVNLNLQNQSRITPTKVQNFNNVSESSPKEEYDDSLYILPGVTQQLNAMFQNFEKYEQSKVEVKTCTETSGADVLVNRGGGLKTVCKESIEDRLSSAELDISSEPQNDITNELHKLCYRNKEIENDTGIDKGTVRNNEGTSESRSSDDPTKYLKIKGQKLKYVKIYKQQSKSIKPSISSKNSNDGIDSKTESEPVKDVSNNFSPALKINEFSDGENEFDEIEPKYESCKLYDNIGYSPSNLQGIENHENNSVYEDDQDDPWMFADDEYDEAYDEESFSRTLPMFAFNNISQSNLSDHLKSKEENINTIEKRCHSESLDTLDRNSLSDIESCNLNSQSDIFNYESQTESKCGEIENELDVKSPKTDNKRNFKFEDSKLRKPFPTWSKQVEIPINNERVTDTLDQVSKFMESSLDSLKSPDFIKHDIPYSAFMEIHIAPSECGNPSRYSQYEQYRRYMYEQSLHNSNRYSHSSKPYGNNYMVSDHSFPSSHHLPPAHQQYGSGYGWYSHPYGASKDSSLTSELWHPYYQYPLPYPDGSYYYSDGHYINPAYYWEQQRRRHTDPRMFPCK